MGLTNDDYEPSTEDELYQLSAEDLEALTDNNIEDFEGSFVQALIQTNAQLLAENQEQSLQDLYEAGYLETASGEFLDMKVAESGISRKEAIPATGVATFIRDSKAYSSYTIKKNIGLTTNNGEVSFQTAESGELGPLALFNSSSLDVAWDGDTGSFGMQDTTVEEGSHALSIDPTSGVKIWQTGDFFDRGDMVSASIHLPTNGGVGILFGLSESDTFYEARVREADSVLSLVEFDGGTETQIDSTGVTVPTDTYIELEITQSMTGDVSIQLIDGDTTVGGVSAENITLFGNGFGIASRDSSVTKYVDSITRDETTLNIVGKSGGVDTNVGPDRITVMTSPPTGVTAVTNSLPTGDVTYNDTDGRQFVTGTNREEDEALRQRALRSSARGGAATAKAVGSALRDTDGVIDAISFENEDMTEDADGHPPLSVEFVVYGGADADIANVLHDNVGFTERLTSGQNGTTVTYDIEDDLLADIETYEWSVPPIQNVNITVDLVHDSTYIGDDEMKSLLVDYVGGTDIDGATVTGISIGQDIRHDAIRDRLVGPETGVNGIASITIDGSGDGTDDSTTDSNGLTVYDVGASEVAQTDATDGSITITTTEVN